MNYKATCEGDYYIFDNEKFTHTDSVGRICRKIIETDPYAGTLEVYRDGKLSLTVNIAKRAKLSLRENDKSGFSIAEYQQFVSFAQI